MEASLILYRQSRKVMIHARCFAWVWAAQCWAMGSTKISLTRWSSISLYTAMKVLVVP